MKPRLSNSEKKLKMINQLLHKKRKFELKRLRIQQQTPQTPPINITINTGFENNQRIKDLYKRLELLTPQEVAPSPRGTPTKAPTTTPQKKPVVAPPPTKLIYNPKSNRFVKQGGVLTGDPLEKEWGAGSFKDNKTNKIFKLTDDKDFMIDAKTPKAEITKLVEKLKLKYSFK